ncbi:hypothetical protein M9458_035517, partial [Cirrhinus mrigala]
STLVLSRFVSTVDLWISVARALSSTLGLWICVTLAHRLSISASGSYATCFAAIVLPPPWLLPLSAPTSIFTTLDSVCRPLPCVHPPHKPLPKFPPVPPYVVPAAQGRT